jgi:hypothetical protein
MDRLLFGRLICLREGANKFALPHHMTGGSGEERVAIGCRRDVEHGVQGKHLKVIVMRRVAYRRLGTEVAVGSRTVTPLKNAFRLNETKLLLQTLGQFGYARRNVPSHPVYERLDRMRIRVFHNDRVRCSTLNGLPT